jgi:zinc transporter ZupT
MHLWEYLLLFLTPFVGGLPAFGISKLKPSLTKLILLFNGAFILGVALLQLVPEVFSHAQPQTGLWVLGGFVLQMLLEEWSGGVEHGHVHAEHGKKNLAIPVLLGLCLHAFIEGLPLGAYREFMDGLEHHHHHHGSSNDNFHHLLFGVILHNIPASFALCSFFLISGYKRWPAIGLLTIFAITAPVSAFLAQHFLNNSAWLQVLLAMVTGNLLQIGASLLFENDGHSSHHFSWRKWLALLVGFGLAALHFH